MPLKALKEFMKLESAAGILLMGTTVLALIAANSAAVGLYDSLLGSVLQVRMEDLNIEKPLLLWINDGLMAVFFFLIGLELKREFVEGQLRTAAQIMPPALGAIGGMAIPALIYVLINLGDEIALRGWAIPAATDIAFALGILTLLGSRVPVAMKTFLLALAIIDDLGAIVVIALFYTENLSAGPLITAVIGIVGLAVLRVTGVMRVSAYILIGIVIWVATLKSGVHATLAGVVTALFIPMRDRTGESPLKDLEHALHPWVAYGILPVFAFANAGVTFADSAGILHPIPLGIACALVFGKPIGIFGLCYGMQKLTGGRFNTGLAPMELLGVALLCGVGFTMSLFVGTLAFETAPTEYLKIDRLGILLGSLVAGVSGYLVLRTALKRDDRETSPM